MQQPDFLKLPCRLERDRHGRETIIGADGAVIFSDGSGDTIEGAAEWLVHCLNTYPALLTASQKALTFHDRYCDRVGPGENWARAVHSTLREAIDAAEQE